jgi:hypothetical protein
LLVKGREDSVRRCCFFILLLAAALPAWTHDEPIDYDAVNLIRSEGFHRSQVMEMARYLTERIGPRLTGSPQLELANEWTRSLLEEWGLEARLEAFDFGHGWSFDRCQVHELAPFRQPLLAVPKAWTPGTEGPVRGRVVRADLSSEEDLAKHKGQLAGAIVLLDPVRVPEQIKQTMFSRYSEQELEEAERYVIPVEKDDDYLPRMRKLYAFWPKLSDFLADEGVVATVEVSSRDNGLLRVDGGGSYGRDELPPGVPALVMASVHYNRLVRLVDDGADVELEVEVEAEFHHGDGVAYNVIADLPGTDLADEYVMVGGHLDSWHSGTGATDNGANCTVVMEAVRILRATGLRPRRTIRVALWGGEEQGYVGSRSYVERYLATRPEATDPEQLELPRRLRELTWPITPLEGHAKLSAYFNLDYGVGRIRGIMTQENAAVRPIFEAWLEPNHDLGATTVASRSGGGTDHVPFDRVGIPAFQFVQDGLDYGTRTHHSNVDTIDHVPEQDIMQSAVVLATFIWHAANRDQMLPRKPLPTKPPEPAELE